jgi:hypothetical protein
MFALLLIAVAATLFGGGMTAYGQYAQGQAQKKMYQYQADVANRQAEMAQRAADVNVKLTQFKASQDTKALQRKYMIVEGAQRATRAAQGIGGGSVTEGDIATDTFNTRQLDEEMIRYNADLKSWDIKEHAAGEIWGLGTQANQYTFAGKNAARAGAISATGTIFSTAGSVAGMGAMYGMRAPSSTESET